MLLFVKLISEFTRSKKRKLQDLAMNKDHVDSEESTNGGVHNPLDVNNRVILRRFTQD